MPSSGAPVLNAGQRRTRAAAQGVRGWLGGRWRALADSFDPATRRRSAASCMSPANRAEEPAVPAKQRQFNHPAEPILPLNWFWACVACSRRASSGRPLRLVTPEDGVAGDARDTPRQQPSIRAIMFTSGVMSSGIGTQVAHGRGSAVAGDECRISRRRTAGRSACLCPAATQ
jgi:hypothetical protein